MPGLQLLDSAYAVQGIRLGAAEGSVPWLRPTTNGIGKRWRTTHLYTAQADTLTLARQRVRDVTFWFRGGRYIGAVYMLAKEQKSRAVREQLTRRYGAPRTGQEPNTWYWLGRSTYILYEDASSGPGTIVHVASLDMLNEQVFETTVRREARAALGWQPDSLGMPRQFDSPADKKK
ncbi:hypothetical protein EJV47_15035 [Hymenobacter gummosus]|uniref:Uncharacterized protein n=1 Tax=Hymenobacter gummosus TaxID=1776032 RepID=A0A3S0J9A7_9BACT|nr:hypothetical protein [Hymenobacter gummosus]RTQ48907.1 hypothetical protein EJV47_15035 [Hymenobacter gummosus]